MAPSQEMAELRGRHAQKMAKLFREFLRLNPTIDPDLDKDAWTPEQTEQWWQFTAAEAERFDEERKELANRLRHQRVIR
jgi:hypothetical protein